MFKITGLDRLQKQLKEAEEAFAELDGNIGQVNFDPSDPSSIEAAIKKMESMFDERAGRYSDNPIVGPALAEMKEKYRAAIIEKAAAARLSSEDE